MRAAQRRRLLTLLVGVLAGCGAGLLWWTLSAGRHPGWAVAFVLAGVVAQAVPAQARPGLKLSLTNVVAFTGLLLGGAYLAVPVAAAAAIPFHSSRHPRHVLFNLGQFSLAAAAAATAYEAVAPASATRFLDVAGSVDLLAASTAAALVVTGAVFTVVNFGLVASAVALDTGERFSGVLRSMLPGIGLQPLYLGLSVLAAVVIVEVHPAALVLLVVPALVARIGLVALEREAEAYDHLVLALVKLIEVKDGYTRGHAERVALLAVELASELGYDFEGRRTARYAALLHDVGKVAVPLHILRKPQALTDEEYVRVKTHPEIGVEVLQDIGFLHATLPGILHHHERMDGRGYPQGLRGEDIPELARVLTVVDAFDAMTSTRAYRRALDVETATGRLRAAVDTQFDARIVGAFERVLARVDWTPTDMTEIDLTDGTIGSDAPSRSEARR